LGRKSLAFLGESGAFYVFESKTFGRNKTFYKSGFEFGILIKPAERNYVRGWYERRDA
jgi:hypothetical protein